MNFMPVRFSCRPVLGEKGNQEILVSATCRHTNRGWLPTGQSLNALRDAVFVAKDKIKPGSIALAA